MYAGDVGAFRSAYYIMIMRSWCIVLITEAAAADYMYQETSQTADHHDCPHLIMMSDKKGCHISCAAFHDDLY